MKSFALRRLIPAFPRIVTLGFGLGILVAISGCGGGGASSTKTNTGGGSTSPAAPAVTSITPAHVAAGSNAVTLTVIGSGFTNTSVIQVSGAPLATTYVSSTQLIATLSATQLTSGAQLTVEVLNGTITSGSSTPTSVEVDNPVPAITSVSPSSTVVGGSSSVAVTGTGFVPTTTIQVNGSARTTTYASATQVTVILSASDLSASGTLALTAVNALPGGGTSSAAMLQVTNPTVGQITLSPASILVGKATPTTVTVSGSSFVPGSLVQVNGLSRATTYVNATSLTFVATPSDQLVSAFFSVRVVNPAPGGGISLSALLSVLPPTSTPVITSVTPSSAVAGTGNTTIALRGTGFDLTSRVQWNGTNVSTVFSILSGGILQLSATIPAADLVAVGTGAVTVNTSDATPSLSNTVTFNITNPPPPTITQLSPWAAAINSPATISIYGTGFITSSTVAVNGATVPSTYVSPTQITATIPASSLATPGNANVTVTTPAPGGGTTAPLPFTVYISIPNNDIVYNAVDGLLYASVPATAPGVPGNAVIGIDPLTGTISRQIQVGSNPNQLALSSDGTQLFVGLDGSSSVAQVNLTQGKVVNQFYLGGGPGVYNPTYIAKYLAAVPGSPNSVVVAASSGKETIYDSGVPRTAVASSVGSGPMSFGSSVSTLYVAGSQLESYSVGSTGITGGTQLSGYSSSYSVTGLQYDNGALYVSNGTVVNASTGLLAGTFYTSPTAVAAGPVVSDSTLGRAFIGTAGFSSSAISVFDEASFNLLGTIPVNGLGNAGYPTNFRKIVRWGQSGIAVSGVPSAFTTNNQIFIFQSPLVKDLSSSPADISISLTAPATATTGASANWVAQVSNGGPNSATGVTLSLGLDSSLILGNLAPSQGTCSTGTVISCDLGNIATGASATVTVSATPTTSGAFAGNAWTTATSYDPTLTNNQAASSTTVSGSVYGAVPAINNISPNFVQAGSTAFTLTVNGTGFNPGSTVNLGATELATSYVSSTKLSASVTAAQISNYGWGAITVSNPAPGGGISQVIPLTIYGLVNVPATSLSFDPYAQLLYATIPSTATTITGNSVVSINPYTGAVGNPIAVGSQPSMLAETDDGKYLYVGLSGANSLAQVNLLTQSLTATIPLTYQSTSTPPRSLATMPGSDTTLAVGISNGWNNFGIFDVNGSTGTFRSNVSGIYEGINPVFASPTLLYAYDSQTSGAEFYRYSIDANGLTVIDGTTLSGMGGFSGAVVPASGLVYGNAGGIANPNTTPPSQVAQLPLFDFYNECAGCDSGAGSLPDVSLEKEFLMLENNAGTWAYGLARYDLTTYVPETFVTMPASASAVLSNWTMLRFGQDGLALLSYATNSTPPTSVMMLLRGPFVAPQELTTTSAASLTSSSATTIAHGTANILLTLTGSNFLPGMAVSWNGSYRTTTIVDSSHVTIAIPAGDLIAAGTATVVATNPGAAASNALQITIN